MGERLGKRKFSFQSRIGFCVFTLFFPVVAFASTQLAATEPGLAKMQGANVTCNPGAQEYQDPMTHQPDQAKLSACNSCKQAVDSQKQAMQGAVKGAEAADAAQVAQGSAQQGANAGSTIGNQQVTESKSGTGYTGGNGVNGSRAGIANGLGSQADSCPAAIEGACSGQLAQQDKQAADTAKQGCQDISKAAKQAGSERAGEAGEMGDLSKLAQAAAGALGPLAQMMGGQKGQGNGGGNQSGISNPADYGGTSPTPESLNTGTSTAEVKNPIAGTDFGSTTNPSSTSFGLPNGQNLAMGAGNTAAMGAVGPLGSAADAAFGGSRNFGASSGFGANGLASGAGMLGAGGAAGSYGGIGSSSGASKSADYKNADGSGSGAAEGGKDENGYDLASGSRPMLGLKGKTNEAAELEGMAGANNEPKADDAANGDRELASTEPDAGGQAGGPTGLSLFHMVRTRYAELKRSGRI